MRFTIGALHEVFQRKKYAARVAFMPSAAASRQSPADKAGSGPGPLQERAGDKACSNMGGQRQEQGRVGSKTASEGPATALLDGLCNFEQLDLGRANNLPQVCLFTAQLIMN